MKQIRTMLVGILGVFLVAGTFATPVYARTSQSELDKVVTQSSTVNTGTVISTDVSKMAQGWNVINNDPNKIMLNQNGKLASGWVGSTGSWYYFEPTTHFMVRNQAKIINGKEYFFDYSGVMIANCNVGDSYYGADGAKAGGYNHNCKAVYRVSRCDATNNEFTYQEFENQVRQGHIKVKVTYGSVGGSAVGGALSFYYVGA